MRVIKAGVILVAMSTLIAMACTSGKDEQSPNGSPTSDPVVIRLGTGDPQGRPDTPVVERFADAVQRLSDGNMRIEIIWEAAGSSGTPDSFEQGVVGLVQDGELELGWIASRAWDTVGVTSFQALQAPFLITDRELLNRGAREPDGRRDDRRSGRRRRGGTRHVSRRTAVPPRLRERRWSRSRTSTAPAIRLVPSEATEALIRALGGRPVYGLNGDALDGAIARGEIDGTEISLGLAPIIAQDVAPRSVITGNVVLFPRVNTLFAGQELMSSLSDTQREVLAAAADEAYSFASSARSEDFGAFCEAGGKVAIATDADVAALQRAALPVYRTLEADPQTKTFIDEIQELKKEQPPADVPSHCSAG